MPAFSAALGDPAATSYVDVATADDWYLGTQRQLAWDALTDAQKEASLVAATRALETLDYAGTRCTTTQALQWPRTGATCRGVTADCTMLPQGLVDATCYLALELHSNPPPVGATAQTVGAIASQQLGELSISYHDVKAGQSTKVDASAPLILQQHPYLVDLLACWLQSNTGTSRVILRVRS